MNVLFYEAGRQFFGSRYGAAIEYTMEADTIKVIRFISPPEGGKYVPEKQLIAEAIKAVTVKERKTIIFNGQTFYRGESIARIRKRIES